MPEREYNHSDARKSGPKCGSKTFNIQQMGGTLYVFCDGECDHHIIGSLDSRTVL